MGPQAVLYAILDRVVDEYPPVVAGLQNDIDEIEVAGLRAATRRVSRRIYELSREVIEFQRAAHPLRDILARPHATARRSTASTIELRRDLRDVADHVDPGDRAGRRLPAAAAATSCTSTRRWSRSAQNEEMRELTEASSRRARRSRRSPPGRPSCSRPRSSASIYGMNFEHMPELGWPLGYPFALALMVRLGLTLYLVFKRRGWL